MLEADALLPATDLSSPLGGGEEEPQTLVFAQKDTPSKPPPAKKLKLDDVDVPSEEQDSAEAVSPTEAIQIDGNSERPRTVSDVEMAETADTRSSEERGTGASAARIGEGLRPETTKQEVDETSAATVPLLTAVVDEEDIAHQDLMDSQQKEERSTMVKVDNTGTSAERNSIVSATTLDQKNAGGRESFFTRPLAWLSYSRDAKPTGVPKAFEEGDPYS